MTDYLSLDDLLEIAARMLPGVSVGDLGLLASAAARPQILVFGADAYPRFVDKAAALMHSLARSRALVVGNRRLAWSATRGFCLLNDRDLTYESVDLAEQFVLDVAAGVLDVAQISAWLDARVVRAPRTGPSGRRQ